MTKAPSMDEVSWKVFQFYAETLAARDVPGRLLVEGLPRGEALLSRQRRWYDWDEHIVVCERFAQLCGGAEAAEEAAASAGLSPWTEPLRILARQFTKPRHIYWVGTRLFAPYLYRHISFSLVDINPETVRLVIEVPPQYTPSELVFRMWRGAYRSAPRMLGLPDARVTADIEAHRATYTIDLPPTRSLPQRALARVRALLSHRQLVEQMSGHLAQLRESYEALARAYKESEHVQVQQRQRMDVLRQEAEAARSALERAHADLEIRVQERTAELARSNEALAAEVERRAQAEQVRSDLLRRLARAREDEQRRIARDLHDQVGQTLTSLLLAVRKAREPAPLVETTGARLGDVQRLAEDLGRDVHGLAVKLRPTALDDLGLHAVVGQLVSEWSARSGVEVDFQTIGLGNERFPADVETVIYRVIQEALTNVARHSGAKCVSVVVQRHGPQAIAVVEDDGKGFDLDVVGADRLGLVGMRERVSIVGGSLSVESSSGRGTKVIARMPLSHGGDGDHA